MWPTNITSTNKNQQQGGNNVHYPIRVADSYYINMDEITELDISRLFGIPPSNITDNNTITTAASSISINTTAVDNLSSQTKSNTDHILLPEIMDILPYKPVKSASGSMKPPISVKAPRKDAKSHSGKRISMLWMQASDDKRDSGSVRQKNKRDSHSSPSSSTSSSEEIHSHIDIYQNKKRKDSENDGKGLKGSSSTQRISTTNVRFVSPLRSNTSTRKPFTDPHTGSKGKRLGGPRIKNFPLPATPSTSKSATDRLTGSKGEIRIENVPKSGAPRNNKSRHQPTPSKSKSATDRLIGSKGGREIGNISKTINASDLVKYLKEELCCLKLSNTTLLIMLRLSRHMNKNRLYEITGFITYTDVDISAYNEDTLRIQIDPRSYQMYAMAEQQCTDYMTLEADPSLVTQTLVHALLSNKCWENKGSLDLVMRKAMKEITEEVYAFDMDRDITIENPVLISGRYLELRLLQKIKQYYTKHYAGDMIKSLTKLNACGEKDSEFQDIMKNSACTAYLRRLCEIYQITYTNFESVIATKPSIPDVMRVWTDVETQRCVNIMMKNHIEAVYRDANKEWSSMSAEQKERIRESSLFISLFKERTASFIFSHDDLLSDVLKSSELMCWMCFGVTINNVEHGLLLMAQSYWLAKRSPSDDECRRLICWNYPLASMFSKHTPSATQKRVLVDSEPAAVDFINRFTFD